MSKASVERWRVTALTELAEELDVDDPEVAASMLERSIGDPESSAAEAVEEAPEPPAASEPVLAPVVPDPVKPEPVRDAPTEEREPTIAPPISKVRFVASASLALLAIVIALILITSGEDSEPAPPPAPEPPVTQNPDPPPESPQSKPPQNGAIRLEPLPGGPEGGSVTVAPREPGSQQIELDLKGLPKPAGRYEAWLYTSILDSESLGSIGSGEGSIRATLPADADTYEFLDISLQPSSGGPHSGRSVLRVPLAQILSD